MASGKKQMFSNKCPYIVAKLGNVLGLAFKTYITVLVNGCDFLLDRLSVLWKTCCRNNYATVRQSNK